MDDHIAFIGTLDGDAARRMADLIHRAAGGVQMLEEAFPKKASAAPPTPSHQPGRQRRRAAIRHAANRTLRQEYPHTSRAERRRIARKIAKETP